MPNRYITFLFTTSILLCSIFSASAQEENASEITFVCKDNNNVPTTVVKNNEGQSQIVFHWQEAVLVNKIPQTNKELCDTVSQKLNKYSQEFPSAHISFNAIGLQNIPVICITQNRNPCNKVLFSLNRSEDLHSRTVANDVLFQLVDSQITQNQQAKTNRMDSRLTAYQLSFEEIFKSED